MDVGYLDFVFDIPAGQAGRRRCACLRGCPRACKWGYTGSIKKDYTDQQTSRTAHHVTGAPLLACLMRPLPNVRPPSSAGLHIVKSHHSAQLRRKSKDPQGSHGEVTWWDGAPGVTRAHLRLRQPRECACAHAARPAVPLQLLLQQACAKFLGLHQLGLRQQNRSKHTSECKAQQRHIMVITFRRGRGRRG